MKRVAFFLLISSVFGCRSISKDNDPRYQKKPLTVNDTLPNGTKYTGEIKYQVPHGKGKMTWRDGLTYEGDFYLSLPHGRGTYKWLNGRKYFGMIKQGFPHGYGKMYSIEGDIKIGYFLHGLEQGVFRVFKTDGKLYFHRYDRGVLQKEWEEDFTSRRKRLSNLRSTSDP